MPYTRFDYNPFERFLPLLTTRTLYFQAFGGSLQDEGTKI